QRPKWRAKRPLAWPAWDGCAPRGLPSDQIHRQGDRPGVGNPQGRCFTWRIRLVWGFSCQGGPQHGPSLFLLRFLGPFFCSTAPQAFFRPDRKMPKPTRAAAVKDGAFLQCRPKGPLVLDGREDGGML